MEVLQIFEAWDQEIDLRFTNHELLIATLLLYKERFLNLFLLRLNKDHETQLIKPYQKHRNSNDASLKSSIRRSGGTRSKAFYSKNFQCKLLANSETLILISFNVLQESYKGNRL